MTTTPTAKPPAAPPRPIEQQTDLLRRRFGIDIALAIALAPLIFGIGLDR